MNARLILCIAMGVFVAHLGLFMFLSHLRPQPHTPLPQQNFKVRSQIVVDHETGEKTVYREITVSTHIATPAPSEPVEKPALVETKDRKDRPEPAVAATSRR